MHVSRDNFLLLFFFSTITAVASSVCLRNSHGLRAMLILDRRFTAMFVFSCANFSLTLRNKIPFPVYGENGKFLRNKNVVGIFFITETRLAYLCLLSRKLLRIIFNLCPRGPFFTSSASNLFTK